MYLFSFLVAKMGVSLATFRAIRPKTDIFASVVLLVEFYEIWVDRVNLLHPES